MIKPKSAREQDRSPTQWLELYWTVQLSVNSCIWSTLQLMSSKYFVIRAWHVCTLSWSCTGSSEITKMCSLIRWDSLQCSSHHQLLPQHGDAVWWRVEIPWQRQSTQTEFRLVICIHNPLSSRAHRQHVLAGGSATVELLTLPSCHEGVPGVFNKEVLEIAKELRWWCLLLH